MPRRIPVAVGLDLAGSPRRTTGFCRLVRGHEAELAPLFADDEIVERTVGARPQIVSVDAPLSLPRGRATIEDRSGPHLRGCDRELLARHIRFFPITLGPMRMLTSRGLALKSALEREGLRVVESYPGGAQDVWGIPRKQAGIPALRRGLRKLGLTGDITRPGLSHDELDAATCALVGLEILRGNAEALGDPDEGLLYLPTARRPLGVARAGRTGTERGLSASGRRRAARR